MKGRPPTDPQVRFWRRVVKNGTDGCWTFPTKTFRTDPNTTVLASRFAWISQGGNADSGARVSRHCGNLSCVNPAHMSLEPVATDPGQRFWSKVDKNAPNGCWVFPKKSFWIDAKNEAPPARYAWISQIGHVDPKVQVARCCGNMRCVNPQHMKLMDQSGGDEARFWRKVDKRSSQECWPWTAHCDDWGYGTFKANSSSGVEHATRFLMRTLHGPIPKGLQVCHRCDNPPCVNPNHLFFGTTQDNTKDMVDKGRQAKGVKLWTAKLTEEKVIAMRRFRAAGVELKELGRMFGVAPHTVFTTCTGRAWSHIPFDQPEAHA